MSKKKETALAKKKNEVLVPEVVQGEVEILISKAIDRNVPVETMEKLMAMRRELKAEKAKEEFDKSMAAFQAECPTIKKNTEGGKTKAGVVAYFYAPLEVIVSQVKEILFKHGFSYSIKRGESEKGVKVICTIKHSAGHSETSDMEVPLGAQTQVMNASQVVAAATTFARRYAFCNAFGIMTGESDTDGRPPAQKEEAKGASPRKQPEEPKKKPPVKPPAKPVKENEGDKLYISPVDKKTMITKQRFIDIIFCNAKKYNIKTDKIINTVYNSKEPIDMQPGQLQTFWGIVKNQIEEQIKALKEK